MRHFICQPTDKARTPFVVMMDDDAADRLETNLASANASSPRIRAQLHDRALRVAFGEVCEVAPISADEFFDVLRAARDPGSPPADGGTKVKAPAPDKPRKPRGGLAARMQAAGTLA